MQVDDAVEFEMDDSVLIIGRVTDVREKEITIEEAHAFHRMWGGSNGGRGTIHHVLAQNVKPCKATYRDIVKRVFKEAKSAAKR